MHKVNWWPTLRKHCNIGVPPDTYTLELHNKKKRDFRFGVLSTFIHIPWYPQGSPSAQWLAKPCILAEYKRRLGGQVLALHTRRCSGRRTPGGATDFIAHQGSDTGMWWQKCRYPLCVSAPNAAGTFWPCCPIQLPLLPVFLNAFAGLTLHAWVYCSLD